MSIQLDESQISGISARNSIRAFRKQMMAMVHANLSARYRQTYSGFLWVVLSPMLMFGAQAFAFSYVLKLDMERFLLFLLSGLAPWMFITQSIEMGAPLIINGGRLLKSFPIHPMMLIGAQIIDNFVNFIAAFLILMLPIAYLEGAQWLSILCAPLALIVLLIGVVSLSSLFALLTVKFRDLKFVISFVNSVSFFVTPIFYGEELVPEKYWWIFDVNPAYQLLLPFRLAIMEPGSELFWQRLMISFVFSLVLMVLVSFYWRRVRNDIYFSI